MHIIAKLIIYAISLVLNGASLLLFAYKFVRNPRKAFKNTRQRRPTQLDATTFGTHHSLRANGLKFHYVQNGRAEAPLMLLLHGFPECWYSWRHQLNEFGPSYNVVAVDLRGYGDSDVPKGVSEYVLDKLAKDIYEIIKELGYQQCVLVAHDWGGVVAWATASKYQDAVSKLIIMNCPHPAIFQRYIETHPSQLLKSLYILAFQLPHLPEFTLRTFDYEAISKVFRGRRMGCVNREAITEADADVYIHNMDRPGRLTAALNYYRANVGARFKYSKASIPVLVIWGEQDGALEVGCIDGLARFVENLTIKRIENSSHWVNQDCPAQVNIAMQEFLSSS